MNLLENAKWVPWAPREALAPEFQNENQKLALCMGGPHDYGKFTSGEIPLPGLRAVVFSASFACSGVKNPGKSIFAMLSFYDKNKKLLERDYADTREAGGGGTLYRKLDLPKDAAYVEVELGARWCPGAKVEFCEVGLEASDEILPRYAKIATTYQEQRETPEKNLEEIIDVIEKAGGANPDVILLSELVYETCHTPISIEEKAQPIPGPLTDTIGKYAKKYGTYIIFTMNENENGIIYNTAVIVGRFGEICGTYRKTHLPLAEAEWGTSPGDRLEVFELDFGKIGILICYDQFFPENSRTLAMMGAEVIFIPTMGEDETVHRAIARTNGVHVVVSGYQGPASSRIIDPLGEIACCVGDKGAAFAARQIDLNKRHFVHWMSIGDGDGETKSLFLKERMTEVYGDLK